MSQQNPTVMVVEDETLLLQAISKKLKLSGIDVLSCASGQQALDYLKNLDEMPDCFWFDFYLKDMNALALMQQLKQNPKWANIPVIVVSNSASPDKVNNMLALGARKYILKAEHRLDEIIAMIREFITEEGGTAPSLDAAEQSEQQAAPPAQVSADPQSQPPAQGGEPHE